MLADFVFDGSVGVRIDGKHYDLHSFFSVSAVAIYPSTGEVSIDFVSIDEFRGYVHDIKVLRLTFADVSHLEISPQFCQIRSDTIEEIGFKEPLDRDDTWLKSLEQSQTTDHLFIRLSSLEFMRICCATARAVIDPII